MRNRIRLDTLSEVESFLAITKGIDSDIELYNNKNGYRVSAKSYLGVLLASQEWGDNIYVHSNEDIYDKIKNTPKDKPVFEHIHSKADIHSYRSDYATTLYNETARPIDTIPYDKVTKSGHKVQSEVYHCRREQAGIHLDRRAMLYTSKALGHNRLEIVANNYIRY